MEPEKIHQKSEAEKASELARLKSWVGKLLGENADTFDLVANYDSGISYLENKTQLREKIKLLMKDSDQALKEKVEQAKADQEKLDNERIQAAEREAEEYNKNLQFADNKDLDTYYAPIIEGVKKMINGNSNLLMIQGPGAIGKSWTIKKTLVQNNADYKEITGEITEAFLYRLIYENNGRILYLKDTVKLLQNISNLTLLKAATDTSEPRILTKSSYSKQQEDLPKEFVCKCKFIFDYNNVAGISLRQDFEALKTRGDYRQIFFSNHDMKNILKLVAKTPEEIEVTDFIIKEFDNGMKVKLNLRTQYKSMQTYNYCKEKGIDWKEMLHRELESTSKVRALLHTLIGEEAVRTSQLKKLLLQNEIVTSIASSHRRVTEYLFLEELYRWSPEDANYLVCINPQPADYKWDKR